MELLPPELADITILRRILFASTYIPREFPGYWTVVTDFAKAGSSGGKMISPDTVKTAVENLQLLTPSAFTSDQDLTSQVHTFSPQNKQPLGLILISSQQQCRQCGGKLLTRKDRPSNVTVYTESFGTLTGTHYHKYCQSYSKGCSYRQHYGYHSEGSQSVQFYDDDWASLKYFISSSETAFEMSFLTKFDAEVLIGQMSYKQKADIYNYIHGYPVPPKKCSKLVVTQANRYPFINSMYQYMLSLSNFRMAHEDSLYNRIRLDRRRFEAAHLRYALLQVASRYPLIVPSPLGMTTDVADILHQVTPAYYEAFTQRYSGMHMYHTLLSAKSYLVFQLQHTTVPFLGARIHLSWMEI